MSFVSFYRALVSYPGSGNTWLRSLIEMVTGLNTAEERDGPQHDVPTGADILVKSHNRNYHFFKKRSRKESLEWVFEDIGYFNGLGILMIRDPFHAIR